MQEALRPEMLMNIDVLRGDAGREETDIDVVRGDARRQPRPTAASPHIARRQLVEPVH
jgi:hypothetical protein